MSVDGRVRVYTRPGCHLCEDVGRLLDRLGLEPEWINIEEQTEWLAEYTDWVPVVEILGRVRFKGIVNAVLLRRIVESELRGEA